MGKDSRSEHSERRRRRRERHRSARRDPETGGGAFGCSVGCVWSVCLCVCACMCAQLPLPRVVVVEQMVWLRALTWAAEVGRTGRGGGCACVVTWRARAAAPLSHRSRHRRGTGGDDASLGSGKVRCVRCRVESVGLTPPGQSPSSSRSQKSRRSRKSSKSHRSHESHRSRDRDAAPAAPAAAHQGRNFSPMVGPTNGACVGVRVRGPSSPCVWPPLTCVRACVCVCFRLQAAAGLAPTEARRRVGLLARARGLCVFESRCAGTGAGSHTSSMAWSKHGGRGRPRGRGACGRVGGGPGSAAECAPCRAAEPASSDARDIDDQELIETFADGSDVVRAVAALAVGGLVARARGARSAMDR